LDKLENFASKFGADFYGLPQNKSYITLIKKDYEIPGSILIENEELIPFYAGETLKWQLSSN
jgi:dihydroorotase